MHPPLQSGFVLGQEDQQPRSAKRVGDRNRASVEERRFVGSAWIVGDPSPTRFWGRNGVLYVWPVIQALCSKTGPSYSIWGKKGLKHEIGSESLSRPEKSRSVLKLTRVFDSNDDFPLCMSRFSIPKSVGCLA